MHRMIPASLAHAHELRGRVTHAMIHHDAWCAIYKGKGCNCVPDISLHPHGGGDVVVVEADGEIRTAVKQ